MWALIFSILFGIIVSYKITNDIVADNNANLIQTGINEARVTASIGSALISRCIQMPVGTYTQNQLFPDFPVETPVGNTWVCRVTQGGFLPTGNAAILYLDSIPKHLTLSGFYQSQNNTVESDVIQKNFASQVAMFLKRGAGKKKEVVVGAIYKSDPVPYLIDPVSQYKVSLSGNIGQLSYTTPAIALGVIRSAF